MVGSGKIPRRKNERNFNMAKLKLGGLAQDARGSIAGTTFSKNASGAYARAKVSPVQPRTSFQQAVRSSFGNLSKLWSTTLTDAQRTAWNSFAATHPVLDIFGDSMQLSGINTFVRLNQTIFQAGGVTIYDPPANLLVASLTTLVPTVTAPNLVSIAFTATPLAANERVYIYGSGPIPGGKKFTESLLKQVATGATNASPAAIGAAYVTRFGAIVAGQKHSFDVGVVNIVTGAVSTGLVASTIAV